MTLNLLSIVVGDSVDEKNFPCKFLLTNTKVSKLRKDFQNNSSANINLSKTQLHKIVQSGGSLGSLLGPLLKIGLPLIGNVLKPLPKKVLTPLGLPAAAAITDPTTDKKMFGSGFTKLIISHEEMNDIIKMIKSLQNLVC